MNTLLKNAAELKCGCKRAVGLRCKKAKKLWSNLRKASKSESRFQKAVQEYDDHFEKPDENRDGEN